MKKVLVVDDEKQITDLIQLALEPYGFIISAAHDGDEALRKAIENPPDLIIADILMPRMDGPTFISELWNKLDNHSIPVIYLTGMISKSEEEMQRNLIGNGRFLAKPFEPSVLREMAVQATS